MDIDIINQNLDKAGLGKIKMQTSNSSVASAKKLKAEELKEACVGFEAILMYKMIKSMRKSLPGNALFPESNEMNIYQSMYDQHLSDELSRSKTSLGIKEFLYNQLKDSL